MTYGKIRKPLFIFCIAASTLLHVAAVWYIYGHPLKFLQSGSLAMMKPSHTPTIVAKDEESLMVEKIEKALEQSLNTAVAMSHKTFLKPNQNIVEEEETTLVKNDSDKVFFAAEAKLKPQELETIEYTPKEFTTQMPPAFDPEQEAALSDFALDDELENPNPYESEKIASVDFTDNSFAPSSPTASIFQDDFTITDNQFSPAATSVQNSQELAPHFVHSLTKLKTKSKQAPVELSEEKMFQKLPADTTPKLILPNSVDYLATQWVKRSLADEKLPDFEYYGLNEITSTVEWEEDLDIDVVISKDPESNNYIFSLTVYPEFQTNTETMRQNFYFLIDRSSSIEKQKFGRFKRAVSRSLAALCDGDNFNIYIFDKNISQLSKNALRVSPKTIASAEDFLDKENGKTHFAATDVYTSVEKMLPTHFDPDEMHSVILITDGNTLLGKSKQRQLITDWASKYEGHVNFYTAACGKGNNLVLLDLLSYATGGKLLYSDTNAAFPRKLVRLVKDLHNPIVKNVSVDVAPKDQGAKLKLYARKETLPPMFTGQPYTVVGTIDELCDLTLFVQGKNHDKYLNIRKNLSLKKASNKTRSLEKIWANTQSKMCYDHFLKNGRAAHLKEAKAFVAPYNGVIAAEQ